MYFRVGFLLENQETDADTLKHIRNEVGILHPQIQLSCNPAIMFFVVQEFSSELYTVLGCHVLILFSSEHCLLLP